MIPHKRVVLIESTKQKTDPDTKSRRNDEEKECDLIILEGNVRDKKLLFEALGNQNEANRRETLQTAKSPEAPAQELAPRNGDEEKECDLRTLEGNVRDMTHLFEALGNQNEANRRETLQIARSLEAPAQELAPRNGVNQSEDSRRETLILQSKVVPSLGATGQELGSTNTLTKNRIRNDEKKLEEQSKVETQNNLQAMEKLLDEKLSRVQICSETQLQNQIKQLITQLSCIDQKVSQEIERKLQTIDNMQFATRDELQQWKDLLEKKLSISEPSLEISHMEKKLEQLENSEKKREEQFKAEIQASLETIKKLLEEKLNSVQTHSEGQPQNLLLGVETQIKQLTTQLSCIDQKVSQEIERKLKTLDNMQFAKRDELPQWKDGLEKKLSASEPNLEMRLLEKKFEQLENTEKKMEEKLKEEIQASLEAIEKLLDEKLNSVQTRSESQLQNPLSGLEKQIKQLTDQLSCIDEKVSEEIDRKLKTLDSMQFANRDELQQKKTLTEKKLSASVPNLEIGPLEKELEEQENSEMEKERFEMELKKLRIELDWRRARNNADDITLDAATAHSNISIAGDKKIFTHAAQPQNVPTTPQRFDSTVCVLGSQVFSSGKHYWEVDVGSSIDWDLGVARKSIERKGKLSMCPKEGIWVLGQSGKHYWAKTDPWTRVMVQKKPKKIGVYLSYKDRQVTFFNVTDMSMLFIFKNCSFSGEVCPFFKNSYKETTMQICSIKDD